MIPAQTCRALVTTMCQSNGVDGLALRTAFAGMYINPAAPDIFCRSPQAQDIACNLPTNAALDVYANVDSYCGFVGDVFINTFLNIPASAWNSVTGSPVTDMVAPDIGKLPTTKQAAKLLCTAMYNNVTNYAPGGMIENSACVGNEQCFRNVCSIGNPYLFCDQTGPEHVGKCLECLNNHNGIWTAVGCIEKSTEGIVTKIMRVGLGIAGGIALLMILVASFKFSTSQGEPKSISEAKEIMQAAVIGLLFIIFSVTILQFIGVTILRIPGFGTWYVASSLAAYSLFS